MKRHCAILILECDDKIKATVLLNELPLVKKGLIDFQLMALSPYSGLSRIIRQK